MKWKTKAATSAVLLCLSPLPAQDPAQDSLLQWMNQIAHQQLAERDRAIAEIRTVTNAEGRKQLVRERLLEILGGLPEYSGPLNPKITGVIHADDYLVQKIIFESLPGFFVTANLYRPNKPGRYPAVLFQSGHTQEEKPEAQTLAANLALKDFVVLTFDPVGQGEREQTYDRQVDRPLAGWSVNEHILAGAQSLLIGESVARFFIWDAKRATDYLLSRPDVDPERLGAAGCSGGGALTTFIAALDPRIKAVASACFINSYRRLSSGLDMADYLELSAPKPWLILATDGDYFTPAGARIVYDEAKRWYGLYGASERLSLFVGPGPHGTPLETREAIYAWMIRWLKGGHGDAHEQPVKLYTNHELLVTTSGHLEDQRGGRRLYQLILDDFRAKKQQRTVLELLDELRRLKVPSDGTSPKLTLRNELNSPEGRREQIQFESDPWCGD